MQIRLEKDVAARLRKVAMFENRSLAAQGNRILRLALAPVAMLDNKSRNTPLRADTNAR